MRRGVALAIVLVALLTVSMIIAVPGGVRGGSVAKAAARPGASDTILPTNQYGGFNNVFQTGLTTGNVYFYATDAVDPTANVAINDYNASRDGLTNPVASVTAHLTGGVNWSYQSATFLKIPLTLLYPGTWNITISGTSAGFASLNFTVETYEVSTIANESIALPGHSVSVTYYVLSTVNFAPYQHIDKVSVTGNYWTTSATFATLPQTPTTVGTSSSGTYTFTIPTNASGNGFNAAVFLEFWANTTGWSTQTSNYVYIAELQAPIVHTASCASGCYTNTFMAGAPIVVTASEMMRSGYHNFGYQTAAPGTTLQILYESGSSTVSPSGNAPKSLTTDANGQAQWIITADAGVYSTTGPNKLNVTPSDPAIPGNKGNSTDATFFVQKSSSAAPRIEITFGSAQYYGGDTVFLNWTLTGNSTVTAGWNATIWEEYVVPMGSGFGHYLATGFTNGTSGEVMFAAPLDFTGYAYYAIQASNQTGSVYSEGAVWVTPPQILLSSNEGYYQAGDTLTVSVATLGSVLSSASLQSLVVDSFGARLISGPLMGNSVSITIPKTAPPTYVEFTVFAVAASGATITNSTLYVDLANGYDLSAGISTKSNYADGSFQPGQTIQFSFAITAHGYYTMPKSWTILIWPQDGDNTGLGLAQTHTTSSSGTISYTIPSGTPNGIQTFLIEAEPSSGGYYPENTVGVDVQSNPSGLGLELGAGSGFTVGLLILLIIIVVVAIVLFLAIRAHGRPKMMKPESGSPPPGQPPQAWQEAGSTGGTPPADSPPTPPSGST
ncbi:MAG TPA: hypothetical protein VJQ43_06260 [Thermoplasmata archaeon]|nr:hypothetical protein [Thermoplasmata archaeon]